MSFFIRLIAFAAIAYFFVFTLLSEEYDFEIQEGDFQGLKIGMSKNEAVTELQRQKIAYLTPVVNKPIEVTRSGRLSKLPDSDGICITDNAGFALEIAFDPQNRSMVTSKSIKVDLGLLGLQTPQPRDYVLGRIKDILLSKDNIVVSNCLPGVKPMPLNNMDIADLQMADNWLYPIPNTSSSNTLHFEGGKLVKITYRVNLVETP